MRYVWAGLIWICHTYSMTGNLSLNGCLGATQSLQPFTREPGSVCVWMYAHSIDSVHLCYCTRPWVRMSACEWARPTKCTTDTCHSPWSAHFNDFIDMNVFLSTDHFSFECSEDVSLCTHGCCEECAARSPNAVVFNMNLSQNYRSHSESHTHSKKKLSDQILLILNSRIRSHTHRIKATKKKIIEEN